MPAKDAVRNGSALSTTSGDQTIPAEVVDEILAVDKKMRLDDNLVEFVEMGRVFGIRFALQAQHGPAAQHGGQRQHHGDQGAGGRHGAAV